VDVCGLRRVDHPDDLQLDARRQDLELPTATTEQHRDLVNHQLVQHTGLERPLRRERFAFEVYGRARAMSLTRSGSDTVGIET
jgi:hypothetical protein